MKTGKCIIFSAPSGAGKTTIVKHLLKTMPEHLAFSVSACSRERRANEEDGKDYYFLGVEGFKKKITEGAFVEWEEVYEDNYYGTLKDEIQRIWDAGKHVIFDVDVIGGINLKEKFGGQALSVFVMPPSVDHLETRLRSRDTETEESITRRLGKAEKELKTADRFDVVIMNDNLQSAFQEAENVVDRFLKSEPV